MIISRGIARTAGRALAVQRANAALFGTVSAAPKSAPIFNAGINASRKSRRTNSPRTNGMHFPYQLSSIFILFLPASQG